MTADDLVTRELMFNRFQRLIAEVIRGETRRKVFQSWEVDLLIDIEACKLNPKLSIEHVRPGALINPINPHYFVRHTERGS